MDNTTGIVKEVVERNFKSGISPKNNKPWAMHKISLNDGRYATIFGDVEPGDTVKLEYNEQYKSWQASVPRKSDEQHDKVMNKLDSIEKKVDALIRAQMKGAPQPEEEIGF